MIGRRIVLSVRVAALASTLGLGTSVLAGSGSPGPPTLTVSRDERDIEIQRASDPEPVRVPVLDRCGDPLVGEPRIRNIQRKKDNVIVTYGKHCTAKVSLKTLAVECSGCD